jgi:shikimate kinase
MTKLSRDATFLQFAQVISSSDNQLMTEASCGIVLIGFMGAGKSSIGCRLEDRTGLPKFDTDELIAAEFNLPIARIFEVYGEQVFREAETATLRKLDSNCLSIIITGGGILLQPGNGELLRELGSVVYLQADAETLFQRASRRRSRPLLQGDNPRETMNRLLQSREPLYQKYADVTVDTSRLSHDNVVERILREVWG